MCTQNHLMLIAWSLNNKIGKYLAHMFTDLGTVYIALYSSHYTLNKMTGKKAENCLKLGPG